MPLRRSPNKNDSFRKSDLVPHWLKITDNLLLALSIILLLLLGGDFLYNNLYLKLYEILFNILWIAFTIEFIVKISLAKNKLEYLRRDIFLPLIILFPFLRPLSLLPISEFGLLVFADQIDDRLPFFRRYRILEALLILVVVLLIFANLFVLVETEPGTRFVTFGDALWFSLVTIATVGYGDIYPKTFLGRGLAIVLIVIGVSIFSAVIARVSSVLVEGETRPLFAREERKLGNVEHEEKTIENIAKSLEKDNREIKKRLESIETDIKS